ncbi:MAG: 16S rRNA (guanine(527)-N(7))-methyltransferase RsmG [Clostridia bacterium]|nr:16S rRNA (guanine(527)-N(7))-methyltransferase RsmG [Clostridia bacterium]
MTDEQKELLQGGMEQIGLECTAQRSEAFGLLVSELVEWNTHVNLTATATPEEIIKRHLLDSLSLIDACRLDGAGSLIDVGCGAGFPGLPLKIMMPKLQVGFLDSTEKKLKFIEHMDDLLNIKNVEYLHMRAEEAGRSAAHREKYDAAVARAVAELRVLAEYCLPLVKTGGVFVAMKGPDAAQELDEARGAIDLLGGEVETVRRFTLPMTELGRTIIIIRKRKPTPEKYPRPNAKIEKKPL